MKIAAYSCYFEGLKEPSMRLTFTFLLILVIGSVSNAQVAISDSNPIPNPDSTAVLDLQSVLLGFIPPRMTEAQRDSISNPAYGLMLINTTKNCLQIFYTGSGWIDVACDCNVPIPTPIASNNGPLCEGDTLQLTSSTVAGATYSWVGPNGFSSNQQNPVVNGVTSADFGQYTVIADVNGCPSNPSNTTLAAGNTPGSFTQTLDGDFAANTDTNVAISNDAIELAASADFGNGSNGAYTATTNTTLPSGTYNYTSFTINSGVTVTVTGSQPLIIKSQGTVDIDGALVLNGGDGQSGRRMSGSGCCSYCDPNGAGYQANPAGGAAGPGGFAGGDGDQGVTGQVGFGPGGGGGGTQVNGSGAGGGYGTAGANGSAGSGGGTPLGGSTYGDPQLSVFQGGSGGGAGSGYIANGNDGGGGGGGGGAVQIAAPLIDISATGSISADGGEGGGGDGAGGGGAGGAIWLQATTLNTSGTLSAVGGAGGCSSPYSRFGGAGGNGRIRVDYGSGSVGGSIQPAIGFNGSLSFATTGSSTTPVISPANRCSWGTLVFNLNTSQTGTSGSVDVLDAAGNVLASNVSSGTDLSTLPAVAAENAIRLRVNLSTSNQGNSPVLQDWTVNYITK